MKIILSGGGSGEDSKEMDQLFASFLDKSKPLLYIPIAMDNNRHSYDSCLNWLKSTFNELGINEYEMLTEKTIHTLKKRNPSDFSGIYIGGGNTAYLLKTIKETILGKFIEKAIDSETPIYGGSAGAVIFAKTISSALLYDSNEVGLTSIEGFNILNNIEITCHYNNNEEEKILKLINERKISKLIALSEKNGLLVTPNEIKIIGKEGSILFEDNKKTFIKIDSILNF
ncbi:type 1 glutamine amidotransferase-like domain-containing protein [Candidatus Woesearchaeota archaeon]|jgi:dipeptidase E|nr:type 1 glutamine amidotransferase-like domain-containing protein [Candidatus Woesearchaeota archaeon]MBT6735034.1 type 1 glutamine amidotransferase-like domain-containing protein [Candidatus Woesearchaeota archaeon]MBT7169952.1 type 1 glutamine amidotransferase-like domain-containing protein [Candidatus Woesearchaeota archaeon]MBT7474464.1 type 1 glutamine amidotransferase-like domain-containing protein [Candidatus Woesearchaeota archaeon]